MSITLSASTSAWRYTVVRFVSRGGDYLISTTLMALYGDAWFLPIIAISSLFNVTVDYSGQKLWAFYQTPRKRKKFFKEALLYSIIRGALGLVGFIAVVFLYFYVEIPYPITALIVTIVLWFASYPISKLLFVGSSKGLPVCFRLWWISVRKKVRS